jgi:outer membrane immunogenic protein
LRFLRIRGEITMKRLLTSVATFVAATALIGGAHAADLPRPVPPPMAPPVPFFTWTGFYVGANLGWGWADGRGTVTVTGAGPATALGVPIGRRGPISGSGDGILGGFQAGFNWQTGPLVFGIETDFQLSGGRGNFSGSFNAPPVGVAFSGRAKNEWFGTIRGRIGYAFDHWLIYATAGGAYSHNKIDGVITRPGFAAQGFSASATGWTWTAGGGVEVALAPNWSLKGEYLYLGTLDRVPEPAGVRVDGSTDAHVVRVGVNFRF